jgi:hypothetical protein
MACFGTYISIFGTRFAHRTSRLWRAQPKLDLYFINHELRRSSFVTVRMPMQPHSQEYGMGYPKSCASTDPGTRADHLRKPYKGLADDPKDTLLGKGAKF